MSYLMETEEKISKKRDIVRQSIESCTLSSSYQAYYYDNLPDKVFYNAKKNYAGNVCKEDVLGLIDVSVFGSGKRGLLLSVEGYVPEGNQPDDQGADVFDTTERIKDDEDTIHLINEYTRIVRDVDSHIVVRQFTSESIDRDAILADFAKGNIDVLTSMKCLDEGVDVPRSEFAIFCASTGNPRQFIQRRGRVLRTHDDKRFAIIHDLVVIPQINF